MKTFAGRDRKLPRDGMSTAYGLEQHINSGNGSATTPATQIKTKLSVVLMVGDNTSVAVAVTMLSNAAMLPGHINQL